VYFHYSNFQIGSAMEALYEDAEAIPDLRLVIADTLQAFFAGDDDNSNPQMIQVARDFRLLTKLKSTPAVLIPAHPSKNAAKNNLYPRGGSSFLNEIDGNLSLWNEEIGKTSVSTLSWCGKFRGASFEPMPFEIVDVQPTGLIDAKGRQMPCKIAKPMTAMREEQLAKEKVSQEDAALEAIDNNPQISFSALGDSITSRTGTRCGKSQAFRIISKMLDGKGAWVRKHGRDYVLTSEGRAALEGTNVEKPAEKAVADLFREDFA
jgi:hypothetical protein